MYVIHYGGYPLGIQQHQDQRRRWMERSIPHSRRIIWTHSDVFWTHKFSSHLPNYDECYLPSRSRRRMVISLHGWHGYTYGQTTTWIWRTTHPMASNLCPQSPDKAGRKQPLPQTREMWIWERRDWISRSNSREKSPQDESKETTRCSRLAHSQNANQHMTIPRLHWLLPLLHTKLFCYSPTTARSHKEDHPLALGRATIQGIWGTKDANVF